MLDVRRLRVLRAIAREGSFAGAARALDYTQPAISHHVRRLEEEVGTPLVARAGRATRLTPAGEALVRRAEQVLALLGEAEEEVAAIAGLRAGRVRVACFPSGSATILPGAIARLRARHPGVAVSLVEHEPPEALAALRAGECDVAVTFSYPGAPEDSGDGLVASPLLRDRLRLLLPPGHPRAGRDPARIADFAEEEWIAGCPRCRAQLVALCSDAGFAPRIAFATDDHLAVQAMVASGLAVAALPELALSTARHPDVVVRRLVGSPEREIGAITTAGGRGVPAVAAMLGALREAAGGVVLAA